MNYKFFQDLKKNNTFPIADKIRIPTLIVHGDADEIVPVEQSKLIFKLIPECKLDIIRKADHRFSNPVHFETMVDSLYKFVLKNAK